jgi:SAM-dependent methyltransferase
MSTTEDNLTDLPVGLVPAWQGLDAEAFALLRRDENLEAPVMYRELAARTGGPVLDLITGQGRTAIRIARAGYRAIGVDLSEDMLAFARKKAGAQGPEVAARVEFVCADVCHLDLPSRFGLIICDDWGFANLLTQDQQLLCLAAIRDHLRKTGLAIIDVFTPHYKLTRDGALEGRTNTKIHEIPGENARVVRRMTHTFDPLSQIETVAQHIIVERGEREPISYHSTYQLRHTYRWEFELLLKMAGLNVVKRCPDFFDDLPLSQHPELDNVANDLAYIVQRA